MNLHEIMLKFPNVFFKKTRNTWWARFGETDLCHKDLDTLAEMIADAQEKGYE